MWGHSRFRGSEYAALNFMLVIIYRIPPGFKDINLLQRCFVSIESHKMTVDCQPEAKVETNSQHLAKDTLVPVAKILVRHNRCWAANLS